MTTLESAFERKLTDAVLDDVEAKVFGESDNVTFRAIQAAHDRLRDYGNRYGYDVEPVIDSMQVVDAERTNRGVRVRVEWGHEAAGFFHYGTSPHRVEGNPVLSFLWEDAPADVKAQFPDTERVDGDPRVYFPEVTISGLPESRYVETFLKSMQAQLQERGSGGRFA